MEIKALVPIILGPRNNLHHSSTNQLSGYRIGGASNSSSDVGTGGCHTNYLTWQEAVADGALPSDWKPKQ